MGLLQNRSEKSHSLKRVALKVKVKSCACLVPLALPACGMLLAAVCAAQASRVSATIEGNVTDSSGLPVPGVEVRAHNAATNQTRAVKTDGQGSFLVSELPVGTYDVRAERPGFAPYLHAGFPLSIGQAVHLTIVLVPAALTSQVTVTSQPPPLDVSQTTLTSIVDNERIEELPVRSRNYLDFVLLAAGVASSGPPPAGAQTPLGASGFTFGGLRPRSNNISIDGLDNNDEYMGASRTELSPETVREFQVVNNGVSAEFGGASGGSINVVTKTGSNQHHGDAFIFAQSAVLNARNPVESETRKPELGRYRGGFSTGGPVRKDRTFYYTAFEQEHLRAEDDSALEPAVTSAISAFLSAGAFPRLRTRRPTAGFFPISRAETEASAKINHQIGERDSLMLRYAFTNDRESSDAFNTSGFVDPSGRGSSFAQDHALVGSLVSLIRSNGVNDLRFQAAQRRVKLRTNDQVGPEIEINGLIDFGRPYEGNSHRREDHYEICDTLGLTHGRHLVKAGMAVNRVSLNSLAPDGFGGVYIFPTLADFLGGRADSFRQAFGDPSSAFAVSSYGAFLQDHWSLSRQLTVDLGARYDVERLPAGFNQDTNNVSPRVGLAYSPSSRWVLRAGFGIFYDRYVLASLNRALEKDGRHAFDQVADGPAAATIFVQAQGGALGVPAAGIHPSIFRPDPRLATSYSQQTNLGIERELTSNLTVGANYIFVRGVKLSRTRNINLAPPVILTLQNAVSLGVINPSPQQLGRNFFGPGRLDSAFDGIERIEDSAGSSYHGVSLSFNRRLAHEVEFSANYTLSKSIDNASDFDEQPENPYNLKAERALSRSHQAQRFVMSGLFDLPFGEEEEKGSASSRRSGAGSELLGRILGHIALAPIVTVGTGRPVDALTGLDSNRSEAFPLSSRPLGFGRNTLKTPGLETVDFRVLKYFKVAERRKLDFVAEFFNLFNHTNVVQIRPFFGNGQDPLPSFSRAAEALNARQVQFSIDFEY